MIEELMETVFADADSAHRQHLISESYAEHVALGEFYAGAREKLDAIIESAIALDLPMPTALDTPILETLEAGYVELVEKRDDVTQGASVLGSLYDELLHVYASAIFKLKRLA